MKVNNEIITLFHLEIKGHCFNDKINYSNEFSKKY